VALQARRVRIHRIDLLHYAHPDLEIEISCGKGTYIRSLARDLGERLGCGAFLDGLRRSRVGPFTVEQAVTLTDPASAAQAHLLPIESAVVQLPHVTLSAEVISRLRRGQAATVAPSAAGGSEAVEAAGIDEAGNFVAVVLLQPQTGVVQPLKVFAPPRVS
jgi:tRNA pseudouridine55 synthase